MNIKKISLVFGLILAVSNTANAAVEMIKFGNMDSWLTRTIEESAIIGGNKVTLYEIAPSASWTGNKPYKNQGGSPWATSNVYAKVKGVSKTNLSVYRDTHAGHGSCAKLYTHFVECKVLGLFNIRVLAAGSIFLGEMNEPITGVDNAMRYLNCGMKINKAPKAVMFDYKVQLSGKGTRVKKGPGAEKTMPGRDMCNAYCFIQQRYEDAKGNVHAKRLGTMVVNWSSNTNWVNNAQYPIQYGNLEGTKYHTIQTKLNETERYTRNSKGKLVRIIEDGWGTANDTPTHIVLAFNSSHGGAFIGSEGNTLWVDNVRLVY